MYQCCQENTSVGGKGYVLRHRQNKTHDWAEVDMAIIELLSESIGHGPTNRAKQLPEICALAFIDRERAARIACPISAACCAVSYSSNIDLTNSRMVNLSMEASFLEFGCRKSSLPIIEASSFVRTVLKIESSGNTFRQIEIDVVAHFIQAMDQSFCSRLRFMFIQIIRA